MKYTKTEHLQMNSHECIRQAVSVSSPLIVFVCLFVFVVGFCACILFFFVCLFV